MALLSLREVSLAFGGPRLLDRVDLQIERGERVSLLGRNGEGKSTLLRLFRGEIAPDEVARYETEIAPEVQSGMRMATFGNANNRRLQLRRGEGPFGMGSQALLAIPEPVISADADLNRGISPAEFRHTAGQRFLLIDRNHDGRISHDELSPPPVEDRRRR